MNNIDCSAKKEYLQIYSMPDRCLVPTANCVFIDAVMILLFLK